MRLKFPLPLLLSLAVSISAFPQPGQDTTFLAAAVKNTIGLYQKGIGAQAKLYNGSKYVAPEYSFEQHPYFMSIDWLTGDVVYDGELFENVSLMLDLNNGQLVTEHYSNGQPLQLIREKVQRFTISGHRFQNIDNDSVGSSLPGSGYYDVLYDGRSRVVVKRQKLLHEEIENTTIEITYDERNRYYIFLNGIFHPIRSKTSVLKVLGEKKQQLKRYLRQKKIRARDDRELLYKTLAEYYDSLLK